MSKYTPPPPDSDDGLQDRIERLQQERDRIKGLGESEREAIRRQINAVPLPPVPDLNSSDVDDQGRVYRRK
jgi:hypothetical protein